MDCPRAETVLRLTIGADAPAARLDRWLADRLRADAGLPTLSRTRLKSLIHDGCIRLGAATVTDPAMPVKPGLACEIRLPPPQPAAPTAQAIALDIRFEDEHLIVIDKPAGMVVHPAPGAREGTLVQALLAHCPDGLSGIGGVARPGIVHRIDKNTTGLMVVAKTDDAHRGLAHQFAAHSLERRYAALVRGVPAPPAGRIEAAIGRSRRDRKKMAVVTEGGRSAVTDYRVEHRYGRAASLLDCRLQTGRTHQIRVHMAHLGHAVIGDPLYGSPRRGLRRAGAGGAGAAIAGFPRQALHARTLGFAHPVSGRPLRFDSALPADMQALIRRLEAETALP